jgi:hypothetical protein
MKCRPLLNNSGINCAKTILTSILLVLTFSYSHGQIYTGIYGGPTNTKFTGDPTGGSFSMHQGYTAGAFFNVRLSHEVQLSLQPAFLQNSAKYKYIIPEGDWADSVTLKLQSVSLPLTILLFTPKQRLYAIGGFNLNIPLKLTGMNDHKSVDLSNQLASANMSAIFGMGLQFPVGPTHLFVEGRYVQGLLDLSKLADQEFQFLSRIKSYSINMLFGIRIPLHLK